MIIAGIDPGLRRCGFAVLEVPSFQSFRIKEMGVWKLDENAPIGDRLERLHGYVSKFIVQHNPRWIGLEKAVAFKNVSSALKLSEARGVIRLALHQSLAQADERLMELSPTAIKRIASGMGLGGKEDVQRVLSFRFPELATLIQNSGPLSHDAVDALAVAWTVVAALRGIPARRPELQP